MEGYENTQKGVKSLGHKVKSESRSVVSDSVRPHRPQPTRLPQPWDSPGKSTGVGFHCLLCGNVLSDTKILYITYITSFNLHTTL